MHTYTNTATIDSIAERSNRVCIRDCTTVPPNHWRSVSVPIARAIRAHFARIKRPMFRAMVKWEGDTIVEISYLPSKEERACW